MKRLQLRGHATCLITRATFFLAKGVRHRSGALEWLALGLTSIQLIRLSAGCIPVYAFCGSKRRSPFVIDLVSVSERDILPGSLVPGCTGTLSGVSQLLVVSLQPWLGLRSITSWKPGASHLTDDEVDGVCNMWFLVALSQAGHDDALQHELGGPLEPEPEVRDGDCVRAAYDSRWRAHRLRQEKSDLSMLHLDNR